MVDIPEYEWTKIQDLQTEIQRKTWELEDYITNLNNLLHALHGEGVRDRKWTGTGKPQVFINGKWIDR